MKRFEAKTVALLTLPALLLLGFASILSLRASQKPEVPYEVLENKVVQEVCSRGDEPPQQCLVHHVQIRFHPVNIFQRQVLGRSWTDGYGDLHAFNTRTGVDVAFFISTVPEPNEGLVDLRSYYALSDLKAEKAKIIFEANFKWGDKPDAFPHSLILRQSITPEKLKQLK